MEERGSVRERECVCERERARERESERERGRKSNSARETVCVLCAPSHWFSQPGVELFWQLRPLHPLQAPSHSRLRSMIKSPCSVALGQTGVHKNPVPCSTKQGARKRRIWSRLRSHPDEYSSCTRFPIDNWSLFFRK